MNRRSFLASILAAGMAPAFVRAESLMTLVRRPSGLLVPEFRWGDIEPMAWDGAFLIKGERLIAIHQFEPSIAVADGAILEITWTAP